MKFKFIYITLLISSVCFGQNIASEGILIKNDSIELPGTLSFTKTKTPLIIWVHGSGGVNRDGNQPQYIKQFRDEINKENIAFFSYDKRTANLKNVAALKKGVIIKDFISDIEKIVNHFKNDNRFSEIILAGHSQGSLIAMMALQNVDKYISIAGAGETIDKTLIRQVTAQNIEFGKLTEKYFKELKETGEIKDVNPNLISLFAKPNQPFFASWIALNPIEEIKKVNIPTLIINGTKDIQVKIEDAKALHKAKPNAKLVIIENMNHVLKNIEKDEDNMNSYYSADYKLSKELITTIVAFLKN